MRAGPLPAPPDWLLALRGVVGRASAKPSTPLRNAEWGTLRGDLKSWQEVRTEGRSFVAALLRMTAKGGGELGE
jgi:hypothetical protein